MSSFLRDRWPYLLVGGLVVLVLIRPQHRLRNVLRDKVSPQEAVAVAIAPDATFHKTHQYRRVSSAPGLSVAEAGMLDVSRKRLVCGTVSTPRGAMPVAILTHGLTSPYDPIVYSPENPAGYATGGGGNSLAGPAMLSICTGEPRRADYAVSMEDCVRTASGPPSIPPFNRPRVSIHPGRPACNRGEAS